MSYPARFERAAEGGYTVTFRDIPEAITQGDDLEEASAMAADALLTAMDFYFEDMRPVPAPSVARRGERLIALPASAWAKVQLLNAMIEEKVRPADLARRLNTTRQEVNRIIDLHHTTKIDTIADAVAAIGHRLEVRVV
jgi:antitoxin HicB